MTKKLVLHYVKRYGVIAVAAATTAALFFGSFASDIKLLRRLDGCCDDVMLAPRNDVEPTPINVNTATVHGLTRIDGIGEVTARAVVAYREAHGGFRSVEELANVSGIGVETLEKIRRFVTV